MQGHILKGPVYLIASLNLLGGEVILVSVMDHVVSSSMCSRSQGYWLCNWMETAKDAENTSCYSHYSQHMRVVLEMNAEARGKGTFAMKPAWLTYDDKDICI